MAFVLVFVVFNFQAFHRAAETPSDGYSASAHDWRLKSRFILFIRS